MAILAMGMVTVGEKVMEVDVVKSAVRVVGGVGVVCTAGVPVTDKAAATSSPPEGGEATDAGGKFVCAATGKSFLLKIPMDSLSTLSTVLTMPNGSMCGGEMFVSCVSLHARLSQQACLQNLSQDAIRVLECDNAGGSSEVSEALSFEVLRQAFGASLGKSEMELDYCPEASKKVDYSASLYAETLGVSVTRAMRYKGDFSSSDAYRLLTKKLVGIQVSLLNICNEDWKRCVLHVWAPTWKTATVLQQVWQSLQVHEYDLVGNTQVGDSVMAAQCGV